MVAQQLQAAKRLRKELQNLKQASDDDICMSCQDHLLRWKAWIRGPDETPYAGGVFELSITCSSEYPLAPPTIKFLTKVRIIQLQNRTVEGSVCPSFRLSKKAENSVVGVERKCASYTRACTFMDPLESIREDLILIYPPALLLLHNCAQTYLSFWFRLFLSQPTNHHGALPVSHSPFDLYILCYTLFLQIFHPNVHFRTGDICLDILKKEWSPAWGLQAACRAVLALLSDYDADSPLNCDAGNMVRGGDLTAFDDTARMYTVENAQFTSWPPVEGVMTSASCTNTSTSK
jgi:ubiquitin-protein ligase